MYTDEPVAKKDVAPGQNFSRFNLLTKITVFPSLGYPTADNSQDSYTRTDAHFIQRFTGRGSSFDDVEKESCPAMQRRLPSTLLIGTGPQVLPLHDCSVDRIQPGAPGPLITRLSLLK